MTITVLNFSHYFKSTSENRIHVVLMKLRCMKSYDPVGFNDTKQVFNRTLHMRGNALYAL